MAANVLISALRRLLIALSYVFVVILVSLFANGGYRWAMQIGRVPALSINPVMYPLFSEVNVSVIDGNREPFYRLFRTYDYAADGYTSPRRHDRVIRVPVMYVHGNAGSYSCARSLARFLYEANVNLRITAQKNFDTDTQNRIVDVLTSDKSWASLKDGQMVPRRVQQDSEAYVLKNLHPILGTELFTVDLVEESFTQSGVLTIKAARFLNHSMHVLMHEFLRAHKATLEAPVSPVFDVETLLPDKKAAPDHGAAEATLGDPAEDEADDRSAYETALQAFQRTVQKSKVLRKVKEEYAASLCQHHHSRADGPRNRPEYCEQAKRHLERFSVQERVRDQVLRTRESGIWVWGESLGGTLGVLAAILSPDVIAGIVLIASPVHYQPLFFDVASTWLFRAISDATRRSALLFRDSPTLTDEDWSSRVLVHDSPVQLIRQLSSVAPVDLAARLNDVMLLAINGGALDDVVPSISGSLQRSFPLPRDHGDELGLTEAAMKRTAVTRRRDLSTEMLRWCGWPMDHRGLVYSLQFLQASAGSLASAALFPNASAYFYRDSLMPRESASSQTRLFPSVVETLTGPSAQHAQQRAFQAASLRHTSGGRLIKVKLLEQLYDGFEEICVSSTARPLDMNNFTVFDEADNSGYFNGSKQLTTLLGYTTLPAEKIKSTNMRLFRDPGFQHMVLDTEVTTELSTAIHLPVLQKGSDATPGMVLRTVYSFTARRRLKRRQSPQYVYPQFCMLVDTRDSKLAERHHTYVQADHIDASMFAGSSQNALARPVRVHVGPSFALMSGVDATTLESDLHVTTHSSAAVYPFILCGSLHAFYVALRGDGGIALGDPEAQLQLFFGSYLSQQVTHDFHYQWKPFSTFGGIQNQVYMCYALGDNTVAPPQLHPRGLLNMSARRPVWATSAKGFSNWLTHMWSGRWLAHFSMYTSIARCGASSVLFFFQLFMLFGWMRSRFCSNPQLLPQHNRGVLRGVSRALTPLWALFIVAFVMETASSAVVDAGLRVCRDTMADPSLTDSQRTAQMGVFEKLTLLALWLKPNYQECQYSWIQIQAVPVWGNLMEHMASIYVGFVFAIILFALIIVVVQILVGIAGFPLARCLVRPLVARLPRTASVLLFVIWAAPTVVLLCAPPLPLCYVQLVSAVMAQVLVWSIPWKTGPGFHFWWPCLELAAACWFPAHFDGLVLTLRNHAVLGGTPGLFWEPERYELTIQQMLVYAVMQLALGTVYCTVFYTVRNVHTLSIADKKKKAEDDPSVAAQCAKPGRSPAGSDNACDYVMGDVGRRHPSYLCVCRAVRAVALVLSVWACVVACRRPIEGAVTLCGNVALVFYLMTFLAEYW